ncbi:hypothetical protein [Agromyces silvae]|uniref:hypothetical protein n=1 Tax=Agromyces silvae TaxID=3388266 RepID=UPI00280B6407|nr:hypothetical protein [Agromyces protaetiae]
MAIRSRSFVLGLGLAVVAASLLTACATPGGPGSAPAPSASADADGDTSTEAELEAAWLDHGRVVGIVTEGSSTCVPSAGEVAYAGGVLEVQFVEPPAGTACTRDLVPRVTLVSLPEDVDPTQELEIRVTGEGYHGDVDLDGVAGLDPSGETDYQPSAGWTDADGQFVLLTWGSSGCPPVVEDVAAASPTEVTVTFQTPPSDQMCTADMAPRGTLITVDGVEDGDETSAILTGAEFDDVRVPILGRA